MITRCMRPYFPARERSYAEGGAARCRAGTPSPGYGCRYEAAWVAPRPMFIERLSQATCVVRCRVVCVGVCAACVCVREVGVWCGVVGV